MHASTEHKDDNHNFLFQFAQVRHLERKSTFMERNLQHEDLHKSETDLNCISFS